MVSAIGDAVSIQSCSSETHGWKLQSDYLFEVGFYRAIIVWFLSFSLVQKQNTIQSFLGDWARDLFGKNFFSFSDVFFWQNSTNDEGR